jgi:hypothetical protein
MAQSLYINFNAEDLRSARVRGASDLRTQKFTQLVAGDSIQYDVYLTGPDGLLDIQDYAEVRLGLGNLDARPESGDYLVAGTDTLAYNHTASELKTVVDSTASLSTVTKLTDFVFKVQFDAVGAQTIPSLSFANLQPRSTVSVTRLITGDATTKETWLWRLYRDPIAFTSEFTDVAGSGVRGVLNLATAGVYDLLEQFNQIQTFLEVELTDTDGNVQTVLQTKIRLNGEVIGHNFSGSIPTSPTNSPEANAFLESFPDPTIVGNLTVGGFALPTGAADGYVLTSDASGSGTWASAGGGAAWGDITGTLSSQTDLQSALDAKEVRTDANGAFSAGDLGGDGRGANAINIQASRDNVAKVASGADCIAIGSNSTASGYYGLSTAIGKGSTASGYYGLDTAIGNGTTASGSYGTAIGNNSSSTNIGAIAIGYAAAASGTLSVSIGASCNASGTRASAIGYYSNASGDRSSVIGHSVKTTVDNTAEIGYWSGSTTRAGAIRVHGTGMVAQTIQNRATAYGDGGATKGSEADNTVIREGIALRRNGNEILVDLNIGGTVTTLSLGTAS